MIIFFVFLVLLEWFAFLMVSNGSCFEYLVLLTLGLGPNFKLFLSDNLEYCF